MTWNNRIFRHENVVGSKKYEWFSIHEAYYDENRVSNWTVNATEPYGETVEELIDHLHQLLADAEKSKDDILEYGPEDNTEPFNDDMIRRKLPEDVFELIHDLCYHVHGRDVGGYVKRAREILKKEA